MRKRNHGVRWTGFTGAAIAGALLLGGCLSVPIPQAAEDPARFYVLNAVTPTVAAGESAATTSAQAPVVQLLPVEVASYLRTRTLIVRRGENEIQFREFARWGEPIELGVARVLREELLARDAAGSVNVGAGHAAQAPSRVALTVRVLTCEGAADGSVLFRAAWELAPWPADENVPVKRGEFRALNLQWDGKSEATLAGQLSVAVAGLAGEIAAALKR